MRSADIDIGGKLNMAVQNPYSNYAKQGVMTASPGELTLMLYDGCIKFIKRAQIFIEEQNMEQAHNNIVRAQDIIIELTNTLDLNYTLSDELLAIYDFINHELIEANITKDTEKLGGIAELLSDIRNTWQQAIKISKQQESAAGALELNDDEL